MLSDPTDRPLDRSVGFETMGRTVGAASASVAAADEMGPLRLSDPSLRFGLVEDTGPLAPLASRAVASARV